MKTVNTQKVQMFPNTSHWLQPFSWSQYCKFLAFLELRTQVLNLL